jgi:heme/copper-type cytochrome/quinol oxidase subunit 2
MLPQILLTFHPAVHEVLFNPARLLLTDNAFFTPYKTWLRFLISSKDVIHSWAVPAFGIKCDAVPGRLNEVISFINYTGVYFGQCSELCGINHGFMPIHI